MGLVKVEFRLEVIEEAVPSDDMMGIPGMSDEMRRPMMLLIKAKKYKLKDFTIFNRLLGRIEQMDKTALKNFATVARTKIRQGIENRASIFGIFPDRIEEVDFLSDGLIVNGKIFDSETQRQYQHLIQRIARESYETVMDEASYTWFNRLVALRYMEIHDYLPIRARILSSENSQKIEPDVVTNVFEYIDELKLDSDLVFELTDQGKMEELFKYVLVRQCMTLGEVIPNVFEAITDEISLLLPDGMLQKGGVIHDLIHLIAEDDWREIEIIGWLYQFYIAERKDEVFANLKKNKKIGKEDIPAATQLFTPKWIVEYMVDNSLGRLWVENHDASDLKGKMTYYLDPAEQPDEVLDQLATLKNKNLRPEDIKIIDPCCGSGHILAYAFDLLVEIYLEQGYLAQEIPTQILSHNLYGIDIDKRAAQLATFTLMMKARGLNRRALRKPLTLHVIAIEESNGISEKLSEENYLEGADFKEALRQLLFHFEDARIYGSILKLPEIDVDLILTELITIESRRSEDIFIDEFVEYTIPTLRNLIKQYQLLTQQYSVTVTNPPYMGSRGMDAKLTKYVRKEYPNTKSDLFAVFMDVSRNMTLDNGFYSNINQQSWMFLTSYDKLRSELLKTQTIINMVHLGPRAFEEIGGEVVQSTAFVLRNMSLDAYKGSYIRLITINNARDKQRLFRNSEFQYSVQQKKYSAIPNAPIAYWANFQVYKIYENSKIIKNVGDSKKGLDTSNNNKFLRFWYEVSNLSDIVGWVPLNKGGKYRKWYGNQEYVLDWTNEGATLKKLKKANIRNEQYYFKQGITWTDLTTGKFNARFFQKGFIFEASGPCYFGENINEMLGYMNSNVFNYIAQFTMSTMHYTNGSVARMPYIENETNIDDIVNENIKISKSDWDSFEISWDFRQHPLIDTQEDKGSLKTSYESWEELANSRFYQLKENEEELNRIFINLYGLQDELTPEVAESEITVRKADLTRDVRSFLSYLVGVMFGRYSLDVEGLVYAGGEFDDTKYQTYQPDHDNIIPIAEEGYTEDDIVSRVVKLVEIIYGEELLEENLLFIANGLDGKLTNEKQIDARERIRRYFIRDFYKDHVRIYQKRPIYWQLTSGRAGTFKGLIYLHRYDEYSLARVRTDYVLPLTNRLEGLQRHEDITIENTDSRKEINAAKKRQENYQKGIEELRSYDLVLNHMANRQIKLDLDDGVKVNYEKFQHIEVQEENQKVKKMNVFDKL